MSEQVSTFYKEDSSGFRAEVHKNSSSYEIHYFGADNSLMKVDTFPNAALSFVESIAEEWISNLKVLNG